MISVDIILLGDDEPFTSVAFEQAPAIGDHILLEEEPMAGHQLFKVLGREWYAQPHRHQRPCALAVLTVRDISAELADFRAGQAGEEVGRGDPRSSGT